MLTRREFVQQATLAIGGLCYAAAQEKAEVVVKTPSGPLRGVQTEGVRVFRGVPFAQPPVGDLRFRAPQPITPWKQVRNATEFAPAAYQQDKTHRLSEDCLYLNIWAPQGAGPFPVYVWIHGGGFTGGRSFDPMFDGTGFAKNGIIVVTVAYRLGVFGFLDMEPLLGNSYRGSANNAVRDLIASLTWVKQNIGAFGGDPNKVTIGGESAGAKLTCLLMGVPSATGLFHQMISESGGAERIWPRDRANQIADEFGAAWKAVGNGVPLTKAAPGELILAQERMIRTSPVHFPLRVEIDGDLIPQTPLATIRGGSTRGKRLLIGTNLDESASFIGTHPAKDADSQDLGNLTVEKFHPIDEAYKKLYPNLSPEMRRIRSVTAEEYWVPTMRVAEAHSSGGNRTYLYRLDFPGEGHFAGLAFHSYDLRFAWNHLGPEAAANAKDLAHTMNAAWTAFLKGEAMAAPGTPAWPTFDSDKQRTMIFDVPSHVAQRPQAEELALWNGLLTQ
ncbi:carboxylesterase/lipase family protein [Terriglobus albidus]|uniref:carboxylesterase/lipase family protein n=1 Tax=Terriglobus albidus TaxID=1592106 RepID=UPI0021E0A00E|nr:carboxylesterase family protein [Terriglobus albidus]